MFGIKSDNGYIEVLKGIKIKTIIYGQDTLMSEFIMEKNSKLSEHSHLNEQTGYLVYGKIRLFINGVSMLLSPGDSWNIPSNAKHKAEIIEDSLAIEIFSPRRDDYLKYTNREDIVE
jgi:quercetin dioxygenase-like cupin family protein